jgi:diaminopimelate epimerase
VIRSRRHGGRVRTIRDVRFTKGHGTANDFVVVPDLDGARELTDRQVAAICDRRRGLGADGVLRVVRTERMAGRVAGIDGQSATWFMDYRNADGGAVEMCGNGIRVFSRYLRREGLVSDDRVDVATRDGVKQVVLNPDGSVTVDMGEPRDVGPRDGGTFVSMGNPHVVHFVDDLSTAPVTTLGPELDRDTPGGTNVEFVSVLPGGTVLMRVWERGVGETRSCGTGACAAVVAGATAGLLGRRVDVHLPGGTLSVDWTDAGRVLMTGPATLVADGEIDDEWLEAEA